MIALLGIAFANEVPPPDEPPEDPPIRYVNSGFGLGVAQLGVDTHQRFGLQLDYRSEGAISRGFQFDFVLGAGLTTPENTVAMFEWGTGAGRSISAAFGDVHDWSRRGKDHGIGALRTAGAFFAYFGLGLSYIAVPVAWILSPFASVGHLVVGPTVSWHTGPRAPDGYVEAGFGGLLYGDPVNGGPGVGCGPVVGAGAHVGKQTVGVRVLVSPPGLHGSGEPSSDMLLSGSFVVTL